ncbi:MAG: ABC transporter ATP-binding protein [Bacilli bacterium]|nr:ABC transporter ATP-binding protein [Bacilli bacterium]
MERKFDNKEVIIEVSHLTKNYGYGRGVFDVSIQVHKGECYGYLGPNGAGKSTTIRHIMGFSKPTTGFTKIFGIDTFGNTDKILKNVGYLPGEPSIPAGLDGWGFIRMMQQMRGEANEKRLNYLLDLFKLNPKQNVKEMSLGDKRKLAVVTAFMNDPQVLILDEPTSGLDPIMQQVFIKFIVEEKKRGKTILLSSHIFQEVDATCDNISIIKDGKHVSTFNAHKIKNTKLKTYVLEFANKKEYERFKRTRKYKILNSDDKLLTIAVELDIKKYDEFTKFLTHYHLKSLSEKPFNLQDYFMSFYKEEKTFSGLAGVAGNAK